MTDAPPGTVAALTVPALLGVSTVAGILGRSPRTVRRRIDAGELPAVIDHGRLMVRGDDLVAYIDRLERFGPPTPRRSSPRRKPYARLG